MTCILLTGMSGVGKSTVIARLRELGYQAVDMDETGWSEYREDGEWVWREDRVETLLSSMTEDEVLFVSGCAINQVKFYAYFDEIVLLSAHPDILVERLTTRTNNPYGKHPDELAETLENVKNIEPLLRKGAGYEIDTSAPLDDVVAAVLRVVDTP